MHLAELLARRPVPAAAVFVTLTRRCPLRCRHCSTMSTMAAEQLPAVLLRRFVSSFSPADHPEFLLMTGGEPLLRPRLATELARIARAAGTRSYILTGAFFARADPAKPVPERIRTALAAVDHVAVSIDVFHEAGVPRAAVFRLLHELREAGTDVSVQACGTGPGDRYVAALISDVRAEFADQVPLLVTTLRPAGRASQWLSARQENPPATPLPCDMAAWPAVGFDGTITACCNADVIATRPVPAHLRLGHVRTTSWPRLRHACQSRPALRAIRSAGPPRIAGTGYCQACRALSAQPGLLARVAARAASPVGILLEQQVIGLQTQAGPEGFVRRHGTGRLAPLALLGQEGQAR
jgi:pyruvate-formate lyase-activating enzyme